MLFVIVDHVVYDSPDDKIGHWEFSQAAPVTFTKSGWNRLVPEDFDNWFGKSASYIYVGF